MKVFLSSPVSTFPNREVYLKFRRWIVNLCKGIEDLGDNYAVYCVARRIDDLNALDEPNEGVRQDLAAIAQSDVFVLIYPTPSATSALIELGFALAKEINVIVVSPEKEILPYMARHLDTIFPSRAMVIECPMYSTAATNRVVTAVRELGHTPTLHQ
ncbi:MAG TPA: hypothetical protein VLE43_19300 [Candidatus Saccharimonadia bacterium]|nr:hypothetical protein [Candidatus Saccharimonadia bacterium]